MRKLPVILVTLSVFVLGGPATSFIDHIPTSNSSTSSKRGVIPLDLSTNFSSSVNVYLPIALKQSQDVPFVSTYRVNAPHFENEVQFSETGVFWFGKVNATENYADVRVGYTNQELYIRLAAFDRYLWYDANRSKSGLTAWDAVSTYINLEGGAGSTPTGRSYLLTGQLNGSEPRSDYQAAYQGDASGWKETSLQFSTETGWRGNAPNNDSQEDRGWTITYHIPFESIGQSGPPPAGTIWGLAVILHDRDDASGTSVPEKSWPPAMTPDNPQSWGQLAFGLPSHTLPDVEPAGSIMIRHKLDGVEVVDGMVGGGSVCGAGLDIWTEWGNKNYNGAHQVNIQNQFDVADWPCFSKFYITFPLDSIPANSTVITSTLTMYQFGNAGGGEYGEPPVSMIQVFTVGQDWNEYTLTWNDAPLAIENISRAWVEPVGDSPGSPGVARTWDVSKAVSEAHARGDPVRLVLYSADGPQNSGKYFVSSDTGDWNEAGRPTLKVEWGTP